MLSFCNKSYTIICFIKILSAMSIQNKNVLLEILIFALICRKSSNENDTDFSNSFIHISAYKTQRIDQQKNISET